MDVDVDVDVAVDVAVDVGAESIIGSPASVVTLACEYSSTTFTELSGAEPRPPLPNPARP